MTRGIRGTSAYLTAASKHVASARPVEKQPSALRQRLGLGSVLLVGAALVFVWAAPSAFLPWSPRTATAHGTVVQMRTYGSGADAFCDPVASYVVDGEEHSTVTQHFTDPCPWHVGGPVLVRYSPTQPLDAEIVPTDIGSRLFSFGLPGLLATLGMAQLGLAVAAGIGGLAGWIRRRRGQADRATTRLSRAE